MIDKLGLKICFIVFSSLIIFIVLGHVEMQKQNEILDIIDNNLQYGDVICKEGEQLESSKNHYRCLNGIWWGVYD